MDPCTCGENHLFRNCNKDSTAEAARAAVSDSIQKSNLVISDCGDKDLEQMMHVFFDTATAAQVNEDCEVDQVSNVVISEDGAASVDERVATEDNEAFLAKVLAAVEADRANARAAAAIAELRSIDPAASAPLDTSSAVATVAAVAAATVAPASLAPANPSLRNALAYFVEFDFPPVQTSVRLFDNVTQYPPSANAGYYALGSDQFGGVYFSTWQEISPLISRIPVPSTRVSHRKFEFEAEAVNQCRRNGLALAGYHIVGAAPTSAPCTSAADFSSVSPASLTQKIAI